MNSEEERIIAFLFKRSGKKELKQSEAQLTLSMDLNWFTPEEAKNFIIAALENKLLEKSGELVKPSFDVTGVNVPFGFYPSKKVFEKKDEIKSDVLMELINEIKKNTDVDEVEIKTKIRKLGEEKNITPEVAALLVGKEYSIYFEDFLERIRSSILNEI